MEIYQPVNLKIAKDPQSVILYGLHEYFVMLDDAALNDYDDLLDYCKKHIEGISNAISIIAKRIVNEVTRKFVGCVTKYYPRMNVAVLDLSAELKIGDQIMIENKYSSFEQQVTSMEIEHKQVKKCEEGLAAIIVNRRVRVNSKIYTIKKIENFTFLHHL